MSTSQIEALKREIAACRLCAGQLPHDPRPVVQFSATAAICIVGQAPGSKVHQSGVPWDDASGERLCEWTGLTRDQLHDPSRLAIVPMGFCYPGKAAGGDKPPRRECAPAWHDKVLAMLPDDRLTLLVGSYAQVRYLPALRQLSMTERVKRWHECLPFFPLPHPAWRSVHWMKKNPWFAAEVLPALRQAVADRISRSGRNRPPAPAPA